MFENIEYKHDTYGPGMQIPKHNQIYDIDELNDRWKFIIEENDKILARIKELENERKLIMRDISNLYREAMESGFKLNNDKEWELW